MQQKKIYCCRPHQPSEKLKVLPIIYNSDQITVLYRLCDKLNFIDLNKIDLWPYFII